jgi:DNA (cytosine-5)-methyltransferase 1
MAFTFVDLFAGIGGFHGALSAHGGECVFASEIDKDAARVYLRNWGIMPEGDITELANENVMRIPEHDVLVGGFPCQPFSKSGKQLGMEETRGTLFWNIAQIIKVRKPKIVLLENVRNIAGPRHEHEWKVIIHTLRELGYRVSIEPFVVSPNEIHPLAGGSPQSRDRVFICATLIRRNMRKSNEDPGVPSLIPATSNWKISEWDLKKDLPLESPRSKKILEEYGLSDQENLWLDAWDDFVTGFRESFPDEKIPGFPLWVDAWVESKDLGLDEKLPEWKVNFLTKNSNFYLAHKKFIKSWLKKWGQLESFPPSRRKFEWQAQDLKSISETIVHLRPSGIRCKPANYAPALVAITQTSILGKSRRKLTVKEAARLQGFPEWFDFLDQSKSQSYKQLGNAVNIGVVYNVIKAQVMRDLDILESHEGLAKSILNSPLSPNDRLKSFTPQNTVSSNTPKAILYSVPNVG